MPRLSQTLGVALGLRVLLCAALLGGVAACQDNDDGGPDGGSGPAAATITGTAAFGDPIVGGTVTANCANGSGFSSPVTTGAQGGYSGQVDPSALPCALQVSGGNLPSSYGALHSLASQAGRTNITPLTDLTLALAVNEAAGQSLAQWFSNPAQLPRVSGGLSRALLTLRAALNAAGYRIPSSWTPSSGAPFSAPFTPDPAVDPYDALLESIADALASGTLEDYGALLAAFVAGGDLPDAPEEEEPATQSATINASLARSYALVFRQDGGLGCGSSCSFTNNQAVGATVGANGSLTIGGKTLTAPFNRRSGGAFNTVEILWRDGQIVYALSNNQTGAFNEINVERINGEGYEFLGQLVEADDEPPVATPLDAIKALAGTYDFSAHVVGTSNGDVSLQQPRGVRAHDSYPLCEPLGVTAGPGDQFGTSRAWPAQVVVAADGSVTVRNPANHSQAITLTPGRINADDVTAASTGSLTAWQLQNPGGQVYSLRRSIRYNDGIHPQPLTETFEFLIGVTANGRFDNLEMRGSGNSPRMAFCGATLDRSEADPLAPLKALAGSYAVTRNYLGGTAPWSTITIGSDGAIAFGGTGPNTGVAEIRKVNAGRRNENNNGIDNSVWVVAVYVNRDLNGDTNVDNKDVILLFLTNGGALRDVQHLTASNQLVDVSVIEQALPAFDDSLAAALNGNGVSGKFDGTAQLVSSTQPSANVSIYTQVSRLSLVARRDHFQQVPQNERKAWQVVVAPTAPAVPVAGQTYRCDNTGVGSQGQFTAVLFDNGGVGLDPQSVPVVQPTGSSRIGGDCEIEVTRVVLSPQNQMRAAEGRFRAVLWSRDQKRFYDAVGFFRYDPPAP